MTKQLIRYDQIANSANGNLTVVLGTIYDKANLGGQTTAVYANSGIIGTANSINFINTSSVTVIAAGIADGNVNVAFTTAVPGVIIQVALSDLLTDLATQYSGVLPANVGYFRAPKAFTLTTVRASLGNAATSGGADNSCNLQIYMNGANVCTTNGLRFNQSSNTSVGGGGIVIANGAFVDDGLVQVQLRAVGAGANGLILTLIGS